MCEDVCATVCSTVESKWREAGGWGKNQERKRLKERCVGLSSLSISKRSIRSVHTSCLCSNLCKMLRTVCNACPCEDIKHFDGGNSQQTTRRFDRENVWIGRFIHSDPPDISFFDSFFLWWLCHLDSITCQHINVDDNARLLKPGAPLWGK